MLNPWLKLNHRKHIYFFVTVATIPALKMTHLLLAGLPRWHIFCQLLFAAVTRNKCRYAKGSWEKQNKKHTHKRNRRTTNMTRPRREREGYGWKQWQPICFAFERFFHAWHWSLVFATSCHWFINYLHLVIGLVLVYDTWLFWTLSCRNAMTQLASENCVKGNKRSWNPVGSFGNPPSMVCSMP